MSVFISKAYDKLRSFIFPFDRIIREIPDRGRILDIGCGHGTLPLKIAKKKRGVRVLGVELSSKRVLTAREKSRCFRNVEFVDCDFSKFRESGKFDTITCIDVLHHMPRSMHTGVLRKVCRMLNPDGLFILVEIDRHPFPKYLWNYMHDMATTRSRDLNYIPKRDAIEMVESAGLSVKSIKDASSMLYGRYMILAKKNKRVSAWRG